MEFFEDLLKQAPDSLIRDIVLQLFPAEGGTGFSGLMLTLNTAIVVIASMIFMFQVATHIVAHGVAKAEAGDEDAGNVSFVNEHTVIGYIRSVIALAILIPMPGSGLNIFNHIIITVMLAASNLAQMGWDQAFESMFENPVNTQMSSMSEPRNLGLQLFEANVCYYYLQIEVTGYAGPDLKVYEETLEFPGRATLLGTMPQCGFFEEQDMSGAIPLLRAKSGSAINTPDMMPVKFENAPYLSTVGSFSERAHNIFANLQDSIIPIAKQFANAKHPRTAGNHAMPDPADLQAVLQGYEELLQAAHGQLKNDVFTIVNTNRQVSEAAKWYNSGGYMRRLSTANFLTNKLRAMSVPSVEPTQWQRVWSNPPDHVLALTNSLDDFLNAGQPIFVQYTSQGDWDKAAATDSSMLQSLLLKFLNDSLVQYSIEHDENTHPLNALMDDGTFFQTAGASIAVAQTILAGIPVIGNLVEGTSQWLTPIMWMFLIAGTLMSDVLPLVPWLFSAMAVFSWIVLGCVTFTTGSMWVAFHIRVRSNQILFGTGWVSILELFFRPLLILVGLWLSYELFIAASTYLSATFSNALNNMQFSSIGVILTHAFYTILYAVLQCIAAIASFWIINTIPGEFSARIPHDGDVLGGSK